MIKCVIIDDEADAIFMLKNILEKNFKDEITIVDVAENIKDGIQIINKQKPEVVFLDIRMREGTGFELLEQVKTKNFEVIFITAYDQYAVKAFQFSAMGYLMKPIKIQDLKNTISNLKLHFSKQKNNIEKRLKVLVENYDDGNIKKLVVSNIDGFRVIPINNIIRLEGDRNYTNFILINHKKITSSKTLGEYENLLTDFGFYRIHQSFLINLKHVVGYLKGDGGMVEMTDGDQVAVSRKRKADFIKRFI